MNELIRAESAACDKKSYVLGLKKYVSCNVYPADDPDDPVFLPDVGRIDVDENLVEDMEMNTGGTFLDFEQELECTVPEAGEDLRCTVPGQSPENEY